MARPEVWADGQAYEQYIGRWSRPVAAEFLRWLPEWEAQTWCDVGCGTGALTHAILADRLPTRVVGVDPSVGYLADAGRNASDPRAEFRVGTASAIPAADGEFDCVVSALLLNFVPDPLEALTEMTRVARAGALIAGYVWDYAGAMDLLRSFWDAATELDPDAGALDEGRRFPLCQPDPLLQLFRSAGLDGVYVHPIEVPTVFADFDDVWRPFLGGQGPAPGYCADLDPGRRRALRENLRARLPHEASGAIRLRARAWAVCGVTPAAPRAGAVQKSAAARFRNGLTEPGSGHSWLW
ncbi:MAG: class I SAM-dependent methyltransferase [Actinomycetota bacterium]|nr:class I SAM-dependent methyltransferase [Actinomycetota bacterium]